jgi:hypothetical protein
LFSVVYHLSRGTLIPDQLCISDRLAAPVHWSTSHTCHSCIQLSLLCQSLLCKWLGTGSQHTELQSSCTFIAPGVLHPAVRYSDIAPFRGKNNRDAEEARTLQGRRPRSRSAVFGVKYFWHSFASNIYMKSPLRARYCYIPVS